MAAAASGIETAVASGAELCQKPATPPPFSGIDCSGSGFSGSGFSGSGFSADGRSWAFIARVSLWNRAGQQLGSFVARAEGGDSYFQAAFRAAGRWLVRDRTALALGSGGFSP
jgi:hypothetical protein